MMLAGALLAAALAALWLFLHTRLWRMGGSAASSTIARYRRALARQAVLFGAVSLAALLLLDRMDALVTLPGEFAGMRELAVDWFGPGPSLPDMAWAGGGGLLAGALIATWVARRTGRRLRVGDVEALLPRTPRELGWAALLSLSAGVTEELFFRLLLPLLIAVVTGSALAGFVAALALFGAAHRYQRWPGVVATLLVGLLLTIAYLITARLAAVIVLHIAIDLNALVLRPVLERRIQWRGQLSS